MQSRRTEQLQSHDDTYNALTCIDDVIIGLVQCTFHDWSFPSLGKRRKTLVFVLPNVDIRENEYISIW